MDRASGRTGDWVTAPTEQVQAETPQDRPPDDDRTTSPGAPAERPSHHTPRHRRPHQRWWRYGFPAVLVLLALAIPLLVWVGTRVVLDSSDGRVVRAVSDPGAPGWEATVDPTPLMALAVLDEEGGLDHVAVLALTGEGTGSVVALSGSTLMGVPGIGQVPLSIVYETGGLDLLREGLQGILGVGLTEVETIDPASWSRLVAPAGPLEVANPDAVYALGEGGPTEVFAKGDIQVAPEQVWRYLSTRNVGETDLNRLVRVEAFWTAWIAALAGRSDDAAAVPGETESGLGRFVRGLAEGQLRTAALPVKAQLLDSGESVYEPDIPALEALVSAIVPFPSGPEGARARLAVFDGTGQLDHGLGAAVIFAANGGQIDKVGNAPAFGVPTTQFVYYDEAARSRVERLRDAIGVGEIVKGEELNSAVDVTVTLGEDFLLAQPDVAVPAAELAPAGGAG